MFLNVTASAYSIFIHWLDAHKTMKLRIRTFIAKWVKIFAALNKRVGHVATPTHYVYVLFWRLGASFLSAEIQRFQIFWIFHISGYVTCSTGNIVIWVMENVSFFFKKICIFRFPCLRFGFRSKILFFYFTLTSCHRDKRPNASFTVTRTFGQRSDTLGQSDPEYPLSACY